MRRLGLVAASWCLVSGLTGCGGAAPGPNPPPPPPPPPPDNTRSVTIQAGDAQQAKSGQPVAVAPAVKVTNATGGAVSGVAVAFSVGQGAGTVTGPSQTTGADGIATVGGWTLGGVGVNTLVAIATGATSGSPATFTATGQAIIVEPAADTTMTGEVRATRFVVRPGVTITAGADLVIKTDSAIQLGGTIRGDCVALTLDTQGDILGGGTIDNACASPNAAGKPLEIIGRTGYQLAALTIRSSGPVRITNDPTLSAPDFGPAIGPAPAAGTGQLALNLCSFTNATISGSPARAKAGTPSVQGTDGTAGRSFTIDCRGNLTFGGGVLITTQHGGVGGFGFESNPAGADAKGGLGAAGGNLTIRATGNLILANANRFEVGEGGEGGGAHGVAGSNGGGPKGSNAKATAKDGGDAGQLELRAKGKLDAQGPTTIVIGKGGIGGQAVATGANGADAGGQPAQGGGDALATGGQGGSVPDAIIIGAPLAGIGNVAITAGTAGVGGDADAQAGNGGNGDKPTPNGGNGGAVTAAAGNGGTGWPRNLTGQYLSPGGTGGIAFLRGGNGGQGFDRCPLADVGTGGVGGSAVDLIGTRGTGGLGNNGTGGNGRAADGATHLALAGNSGDGGDGLPNGAAGLRGRDQITGQRIVDAKSVTAGLPGLPCIRVGPVQHSVGYQLPQGSPCQLGPPSGSFTVLSVFDGPITGTGSIRPIPGKGSSGMTVEIDPNVGFIAQNRGPTTTRVVVPDTRTDFTQPAPRGGLIWTFFDPCVARDAGGPFEAEFHFAGTAGTKTFDLIAKIIGTVNP